MLAGMNSQVKTPIPLLSGVNLNSVLTKKPIALRESSGVFALQGFSIQAFVPGITEILKFRAITWTKYRSIFLLIFIFITMTGTAPRNFGGKLYEKKVPHEGRMGQSGKAEKTRAALLETRLNAGLLRRKN